jgi:hypothetical protein
VRSPGARGGISEWRDEASRFLGATATNDAGAGAVPVFSMTSVTTSEAGEVAVSGDSAGRSAEITASE